MLRPYLIHSNQGQYRPCLTHRGETDVFQCVYWGGPVSQSNALNFGQYRNKFHVVIAGSNGYVNRSIDTPAGYTAPTYLGNSIINLSLIHI